MNKEDSKLRGSMKDLKIIKNIMATKLLFGQISFKFESQGNSPIVNSNHMIK